MRSFKSFTRQLSLVLCALLVSVTAYAADETSQRGPLLATVNGEPIHVRDLQAYAKGNPIMTGYMTHLPGVRRVLDDLINVKLLVLEGQRLGIQRNEDEKDDRYALRLRNQLMEKCERPDEAEAKGFYEAHPEVFSTPAYVRVNKVYLKATDKVEDMDAMAFLKRRSEGLRDGSLNFEDIVAKVRPLIPSDIRLGDMGFIPLNEKDPLIDQLSQAKVHDLIGPFENNGFIYLFQVTDRRDPIVLSWDEVKGSAQDMAFSHCMQTHFAKLRREIESRFPVVIYEETLKALKFN
ncbi:MAG: peptidyl-prolyl cis-trans isomerase [Pseudomonadota bacterium]